MRRIFKPALLMMFLVSLAACKGETPVAPVKTVVDVPANADEGGALSGGSPPPAPPKADVLEGTDWPKAELVSGEAFVSCTPERPGDGDGTPLTRLDFEGVDQAVSPCKDAGVLRLRYQGKIGTDFTALIERVAHIARRMDIRRRILDIDSSGGHVEDAMKAGDAIGASQWTLQVRDDAICHSACVLILAAGDDRAIAGKVGIHRMIRVGSSASTRAELSQELREVYSHMKDYLERNGAAVTVADLMMTVPNRKLRLLTDDELLEYGLDGTNAVQDDLERIRLTRECGDDFVRRKDDFARAFERECARAEGELAAADACGLELRRGFGFPDEKCPDESPLSELESRGDVLSAAARAGGPQRAATRLDAPEIRAASP